MFLVGSVVYIVPAIVFMFFGSGELQPWNEPDKLQGDTEGGGAQTKVVVVAVIDDPENRSSVTRL